MAHGKGTLDTMSPDPVVPLFLLLLALQRSFAPLVTGVPREPAVFQFQCNVYFFTKGWFPWSARPQQTAFVIYWMHCLPGHSGVLLQFQSGCSDWVNVWYMNYIQKSDRMRCLFAITVMLHWGGVMPSPEVRQTIQNWLSCPARPIFGDCWGAAWTPLILEWSMTPWTPIVWYIPLLGK